MIWFILIIVIGVILYSFLSSQEKKKQQVEKQGGMDEKYSILIETLTTETDWKVTILTRDNIRFQARTDATIHHFSILQGFNEVIITWKAVNPLGNFQDKWQFPQHLSQYQMAKKIGDDIKFKFDNYGDYDLLNSRINQAIDKLDL